MKPILLLFIILFSSCTNEDTLIANYTLNGNLNDYAQARVAIHTGEVNFIKTKNTKGLRYSNTKPVSFITLPDISLNPKEYTISMFINLYDFKHNSSILFYGNDKETWGNSGLWIYTDKNKIAVFQENQVLSNIEYSHKSKKNDVFNSSLDLKPKRDYFLTVTYKNEKLSIFIDGKEYAKYTQVKLIKKKERKVLIGIANDPKSKGKFQYNGIIDEIQISNKSMTSTEIQNLFSSYKKN